jgi:hypothetical protein
VLASPTAYRWERAPCHALRQLALRTASMDVRSMELYHAALTVYCTEPGLPPRLNGEGPPAPRGSFRGRSPAGTCRPTYADRCARLRQKMLLPVHPLRSIRRFQGRGVGRQIALHMCQLLDSTVPCPDISAVRSRHPALSGFASESHLRSWRNIGACHPARATRASSGGSRVSMHSGARGQPSPSICRRNPERPVAARRELPF